LGRWHNNGDKRSGNLERYKISTERPTLLLRAQIGSICYSYGIDQPPLPGLPVRAAFTTVAGV